MHFPFTIPKAFPRIWLCFFCVIFAFINGHGEEAKNGDKVIYNIGAIIDVNSRIGKEQQIAMEIAAQNYNNNSKKNKLALYFQNPTENPFKTISLAADMVEKQKVEVIIGMQTWQEAALTAEVGNQAQVPVISFAAPTISPPLTPIRWPFLIRFANNGTAYIKCIADIVYAFSWQRVVAIYEDDAFGGDYGMLTLLSDALQDVSSTIEHRFSLPPASSLSNPRDFVRQELLKLLQVQSRVFIVLHSSFKMVNLLFREAKEMGFVDRESAWIIPESITNILDSLSKDTISNMEGALGINTYFYENTSEYQDFHAQFRRTFRGKNPDEDNINPGFYALRAYDSIKIVTQAIDRIANENSSNSPKTLLREISSSSFLGLSGYIQFDSGQLMQNPTLRIVNVVGRSYKELDLWTEEHGFNRSLPTGQVGEKAAGWAERLVGAVHWPGNLPQVPKGWNMPSKQKPMKIAVPGRTSFSKFVKVDYSKNLFDKSAYSGFCIDIFDMVRPLLGYDLPFDYYPINTTYPDLVQLVYNKTFDAVVGDMTLLAERLQYVDFTVPYAESGLSMVVPAKSEQSTWMFTKPFTWQLWAVTGGVLIYTVLVVWYLERNPNPEFQGDWKNQISTSLWFTFCSIFFAHREKMHSNLTRVVMVAWLSLIFVLSSSYTASLSSMLTVQQLKPNVTDIAWLKKYNMKIGCDGDSFIRTYLEKVDGFQRDNIINISSEDSYVDAFRNNTVAAAFIELPYEKVFISKNCKGFSGSTPTTRFGGLGFMFQKGSPVARDVSHAILVLSEKGELKKLEEKWLNPSRDECSSNITSTGTESLKLESFWVLYLISGATSTICFLLYTLQSLHKRKQDQGQEGNNSPSYESAWKMAIKLLAKQIYSRKLNNNTREAQYVTDCSSRWDYLSDIGSPQQQQAMASALPEILMLPSPPIALEMANSDHGR